MISANEDVNASAQQIRAAFPRAGEPKRLLEVAGDHYSIYPWTKGQNADEVTQAAADWFAEHLSGHPHQRPHRDSPTPSRDVRINEKA
jgi:hypothetical protein